MAHAQTNAEVNAGIQLNFSTPGARSLALGGAFLGLADDATAAFANPAGLTILSKPEVSVEGRRWSYSPKFIDRGHAFGDPTNIGVDNVPGLVSKTSKDDVTGLSFLSFVYPGKRWAVAVYRQELANFKTTFKTNGAFFDDDATHKNLSRVRPVDARLDLKIVNLGISGAYRVNDDLSIGLGVSSYDFTLNSISNRYNFNRNPPVTPDTTAGGEFGPPNYDPANILNSQDQSGDGRNVAVNGGILWKVNTQWSAGAVYRQGPKFSLTTTNTRGPASGDLGRVVAGNRGTFHVPDVFGAGVAFRPADAWTITADYDRVRYSQLAKRSVDVFFDPTDPGGANERSAASHLVADDANEFHLGAEYVLALKHPVAFRAGGWLDPDHRVRFGGDAVTVEDRSTAVRFPRGKNEIHYSVGLGVVVSDKFQIDAAADFSKLVKTASFSGVFRF
ncbi:MAG TPA: outer membrane protein transport protein [Thermoanaerobaculia bacterium]|nr:outer membrane protein transport protein [Thermoanaerobaculia bacterium]